MIASCSIGVALPAEFDSSPNAGSFVPRVATARTHLLDRWHSRLNRARRADTVVSEVITPSRLARVVLLARTAPSQVRKAAAPADRAV